MPGEPIRDVAEYRPRGARNFIRIGDMVRVDPPVGRAFLGTVHEIVHRDGLPLDGADARKVVLELCVRKRLNGNDHPQAGMLRIVTADRITRLSQTRREARP
jgi:hypothetical protein